MPRVPDVVLVRHGETEWSRTGRHTGRTDVPLTDSGRRQARSLAARLAGSDFRRVLYSPLSRAAETCRLAGLGEGAVATPEVVEWDYGDYEGRTTADIRGERPAWSLWSDGCPGGEGAAQVASRVDVVIARLRRQSGCTAIFAHGHVLRALAARWIGLGAEEGRCFLLEPATLSLLGYERDVPVVSVWNAPLGD